LFLEELAWAVREQGDLRFPAETPTTVQAVLAARLDRLPPVAKHLLQTAAGIGPEVPWPLLQAVAGLDEDELRRVLLQLQVAEFLYETRLIPKAAYTFKHALTQEVAYSSLLLDLYWAMDMTFWLPEAQAALAQSGSALALPQHRELRQSSG
jgi:predicted ATPase